jgi:branched-chain amino acid transport system permease protein
MNTFFQQALNGIVEGSALALVALGFTLVYGTLRVLNLAHPQIYMWGAFVTYLGVRGNWPLVLVLVAVLASGGAWGVLLDRGVFRWLRNSDMTTPFIATMGLSLAMESLAVEFFGPQPVPVKKFLAGGKVHIGSAALSWSQIIVVLATLLVLGILWWLVSRTWFGRSIRATAENAEGATVIGINSERVMLLTVVIASVFAALAGFLIAGLYHQSFAYMADTVGLEALVVVKVGGLGNLPGAALAALIVGLVEAYATQYVSASYSQAILFGFLLLVLVVRPTGILGDQERAK